MNGKYAVIYLRPATNVYALRFDYRSNGIMEPNIEIADQVLSAFIEQCLIYEYRKKDYNLNFVLQQFINLYTDSSNICSFSSVNLESKNR